MHAADPVLSRGGLRTRVERAIDHLELEVGVALIQTHLEIVRRGSGTGIIGSRPPLDIEYPIWRASTNRGKHTTVPAVVTATTTSGIVGAQILPRSEDREIIRPNVWRRRQTRCDVAAGFVSCHEVKAPIGTDVHRGVGLGI